MDVWAFLMKGINWINSSASVVEYFYYHMHELKQQQHQTIKRCNSKWLDHTYGVDKQVCSAFPCTNYSCYVFHTCTSFARWRPCLSSLHRTDDLLIFISARPHTYFTLHDGQVESLHLPTNNCKKEHRQDEKKNEKGEEEVGENQ